MSTQDGSHVVMRQDTVVLSNTTSTIWSLEKVADQTSTWFIYTTNPDGSRIHLNIYSDTIRVEQAYAANPYTIKFYNEWDHKAPEAVIYAGELCFNVGQGTDDCVWMSAKTQCTSMIMKPAIMPQYHSTDLMCDVDPLGDNKQVQTGMFLTSNQACVTKDFVLENVLTNLVRSG
jgi:ubiquitin-protein ligase